MTRSQASAIRPVLAATAPGTSAAPATTPGAAAARAATGPGAAASAGAVVDAAAPSERATPAAQPARPESRPAAAARTAPPTESRTESRPGSRTEAPRTEPRTASAREAREPRSRTRNTGARATASVPTGLVQIAVSPWGQVEVDGMPAGTSPPLNQLTLAEGRHTLVLRNDAFAPHTVVVQVVPGQTVNVRHRFGP